MLPPRPVTHADVGQIDMGPVDFHRRRMAGDAPPAGIGPARGAHIDLEPVPIQSEHLPPSPGVVLPVPQRIPFFSRPLGRRRPRRDRPPPRRQLLDQQPRPVGVRVVIPERRESEGPESDLEQRVQRSEQSEPRNHRGRKAEVPPPPLRPSGIPDQVPTRDFRGAESVEGSASDAVEREGRRGPSEGEGGSFEGVDREREGRGAQESRGSVGSALDGPSGRVRRRVWM
mmetsp:Transcript_33819/g.69036  ORF Transcript_33819/g.69036 Transcript_33819/m.69036 type:complete len:228 (-) Transcript_33819:157-840(-)